MPAATTELEERGPRLSLVGAIDDATGLVPWACFREQEDAHGYVLLMRQVVGRHGIPVAAHSNQNSIFHATKTALTIEDQLDGDNSRSTQFGRLLNELGVTLILARSPQARGRIERLWGTFQDRLTSELRLAGAATLGDAEQVLGRTLLRHNRRFTHPCCRCHSRVAALAGHAPTRRGVLLQIPARGGAGQYGAFRSA